MHAPPLDQPLPTEFCWTRFGPEAGEPIEAILARKEAERLAGDGIFYWGIGSAVSRGIEALVAAHARPELLFSPIAGRPRDVDVSPGHVARWTAGRDLFGQRVALPRHARVTSRWNPERPNTARYALICSTERPLGFGDHGAIAFGSLRNLTSGAPLGASQVTAVVSRDEGLQTGREYMVAMRVALVFPYVLRLEHPVLVTRDDTPELREQLPLVA